MKIEIILTFFSNEQNILQSDTEEEGNNDVNTLHLSFHGHEPGKLFEKERKKKKKTLIQCL